MFAQDGMWEEQPMPADHDDEIIFVSPLHVVEPRDLTDHRAGHRQAAYMERFVMEWLYDAMRQEKKPLRFSRWGIVLHYGTRYDSSRAAFARAFSTGISVAERQKLHEALEGLQERLGVSFPMGLFKNCAAGKLTGAGLSLMQLMRTEFLTGRLERRVMNARRFGRQAEARLEELRQLFAEALKREFIKAVGLRHFCRTPDPVVALDETFGPIDAELLLARINGRTALLEELRYRIVSGQYPEFLPSFKP